MSFGFRNKLALALAGSVFVAFASGQAFAQQASGTQTQESQPVGALSPAKVAEYLATPGKMLVDFAGKPAALSAAITQIAMSGTEGANAATVFLGIAAGSGNKELATAAAKGLGNAVSLLNKAGNVALASSLQATVASITQGFPAEIAAAVLAGFADGQGGVATAAVGAGGSDNATGSAGSGGNGSNSPTIGASNGFSGGAFSGTSTANSGTTSFGGAGGPSSGSGDTTSSFSITVSTSTSASPT